MLSTATTRNLLVGVCMHNVIDFFFFTAFLISKSYPIEAVMICNYANLFKWLNSVLSFIFIFWGGWNTIQIVHMKYIDYIVAICLKTHASMFFFLLWRMIISLHPAGLYRCGDFHWGTHGNILIPCQPTCRGALLSFRCFLGLKLWNCIN